MVKVLWYWNWRHNTKKKEKKFRPIKKIQTNKNVVQVQISKDEFFNLKLIPNLRKIKTNNLMNKKNGILSILAFRGKLNSSFACFKS
jgi:hypothetical protein